MDYDDRKKSKFRSDRYSSGSSSSKNSRYRDDDDDDDRSKRIKSRSRSRSRGRTIDSGSYGTTSALDSKFKAFLNGNAKGKSKHDDSYTINTASAAVAMSIPVPVSHLPLVEKRFNMGTPSRTIMLRQLPVRMEDSELRTELNMLSVPYKDVRLVKNRDTGLSRGFAFIEFSTVDEAQAWMNATRGCVIFSNYDNKVQLFYSNSSDDANYGGGGGGANGRNLSQATDWDCAKCGIKNFKRRDRCFKCSITREESDRRKGGEGFDYVGSNPCNTLLIRGLDALTTTETIINVLNKLTNYTLSIKNCHIAKDILTNVSSGFAFVEMGSIQDAGYMLQVLQPHFEVDGKQVVVNYSKNSFKTALSQLETNSRNAYNQQNEPSHSSHHSNINNKVNQADQANSAAAVAQAAMLSMHKKQEILSHITSTLKQTDTTASTDIDSTIGANLQLLAKQVDMISNKVYPTPDITQFTYDEASGYYYDYTTGFYYDAVSQYFFNSLTQQYMYWDASKSTYIPVTSDASSTTTATTTNVASAATTESTTANSATNEDKTSSSNKSSTVKTVGKTAKTAAQIAKDMEKWAESMNKKKVSSSKPVTTTTSTPSSQTTTITVPKPVEQIELKASKPQETIANNISPGIIELEKVKKSEQVTITDATSDTNKKNSEASLQITEINNGHDQQASLTPQSTTKTSAKSIEEIYNLIDISKIACLLCKRKLDTLDILNKHIAKSDLHKKNLEKFKEENGIKDDETKQESKNESDSLLAALQYRDRAKERQIKYGTPEPETPSRPAMTSSSSTSSKTKHKDMFDENDDDQDLGTPSDKESVASKLMKKMGWNEGTGIGKNLQGISAPIEATMRSKRAGLGAAHNYEVDPNDSYKDAVRKSARARFESLN